MSLFHFPSDVRYACQCCGACCRDTWEIRVEPDAAERVLAADWRSCCTIDSKEDSPFKLIKGNTSVLTFKRHDDACVFLGEGNRCRMHERFGIEIKPFVCQRFPYRFVETPGGVYVGMSFACPSVLQGEGPLVADAPAEAERIHAINQTEHLHVNEPIQLDKTLNLSWDEYQQIEQTLDAIFSHEEYSVAHCLIAGHAWLSMLRRLMRQAGPTALPFFIKQTTDENFARVFKIAQRPVAHGALKRMLLGSFLSFRNTLRPGQSRLFLIPRLTFANLRHWCRWGSVPLEPLDKCVSYKNFAPSHELLEDAETQSILRRYYRHALFRKELVQGTDLFWGYCYLVLVHGLIEYYAAGLKAAGEENPARAIQVVEKYFVHHSTFGRTFLYHPAMLLIFQRVFDRPNFAHTIVLG
ncbi:TPA: hypothetical protein DDW35_06705 [Candidatus Sumerlaeota bacterium]|jgi:Fe-S-cluster containining protein|nr:hypothetical protein [Candidatus Sumerlaeota bacterium]